MVNTYNSERTVLATVIMAHFLDIKHAEKIPLYTDFFQNNFHKSVVNIINQLRSEVGFVDEELVEDRLARSGLLNVQMYTAILSANPFASRKQLDLCIGNLKRNLVA